jgi:DNA-binding IclR family transcriptional regulator
MMAERLRLSGSICSAMVNGVTAQDGSATLSSVDRALSMVELLSEEGHLNVTQLAERLGTGKATAFRLAHTLMARGWMVQDPDRRYRLGPGILGVAARTQAGRDVRADLRPVLEALHEKTGETIHLTKLDGRHVVYLEQIISSKPVRSVAMIGGRSPAHCVSPGLAQLAALPDDQLNWVLGAPLQRYTDASMTDPAEVRAELDRVRERGYAVNLGNFRPDVGGVGTAVTDADGYPIAGLSVCVPVYRLKELDTTALGEMLKDAAQDARRRLHIDA